LLEWGFDLKLVLLLAIILLFPLNGYAYIGPGLGIGTIGAVFGILLSLFMTLLSILWYPFKILIRKIRKKEPDSSVSRPETD
jgi:hypothetical protein